MKNYVKPTLEILEKKIEKSAKYTDNSEAEYIYELGYIHTLTQHNNITSNES